MLKRVCFKLSPFFGYLKNTLCIMAESLYGTYKNQNQAHSAVECSDCISAER